MSELPEKQVKRLKSLITEAETNLAAAKELLMSILGDDDVVVSNTHAAREEVTGKVIEGVFDGQIMVGPDGKTYPVPANYASKSKLVEGDIFRRLNGFDETFPFGLEDVDFCLRVRQAGHRIVCCQETDSLHFESMTPGRVELDIPSRHLFMERWKNRYTVDG